MADYLTKAGLERFLGKIKNIFALKADTYTKSEVDALVAEGGGGTSEIDIDLLVPITWAELKDLRDNGQMVAGTQYRINDYHTSVDTVNGCSSEQYPFDIIVTADSESALNEHARAINHPIKLSRKTIYVEDDEHNTFFYERHKHNDSENLFGWCKLGYENITPEMVPIDWDDQTKIVQVSIDIEKLSIGDEFTIDGKNVKLLSIFDEVDHFKNCNLAVWELKYCLDNDKSRFEWATDYGRGVIYYMKDEWGNECPYDFKNIKFNHRFNKDGIVVREQDEYVSKDYVYTFCCMANSKDAYYNVDASIFCNDGTLYGAVVDNVIKPYIFSNGQQKLNNNVFFSNETGCNFSRNTLSRACYDNIFNVEAIDNHLGVRCYKNYSFGYFSDNTLADECYRNYFSGEVHRNVFGLSFCYNSLSGECYNNEFDEYCSEIILKGCCDYNIFGKECSYVTLEGSCMYNIFGHYCNEIYILDSDCNLFGSVCHDIYLYTECNYNTFGHGCYSSTFEYYCDNNRIDKNCKDIYLEADCCYNHISDDSDDIYITKSSHHNNIGVRCSSIYFGEENYAYVSVLANTIGETITGIEPNASYPQVCGYDENENYIAKPMLSSQTENSLSFNDVTLIGVSLQSMFVRAPKGLLKESDKPVFARYRKSKIRGSDNGNYWAGDNTEHVTVKGWIVPLTHPMPSKRDGGVHKWAEDMSLQKISPNDYDLGCSSWDGDYDFFLVLCDGEDFISWMSWARYNENITGRDNNNPLNLVAQKLGIRIDRGGKTIVNYLPFSIQEVNGELVYGRWR